MIPDFPRNVRPRVEDRPLHIHLAPSSAAVNAQDGPTPRARDAQVAVAQEAAARDAGPAVRRAEVGPSPAPRVDAPPTPDAHVERPIAQLHEHTQAASTALREGDMVVYVRHFIAASAVVHDQPDEQDEDVVDRLYEGVHQMLDELANALPLSIREAGRTFARVSRADLATFLDCADRYEYNDQEIQERGKTEPWAWATWAASSEFVRRCQAVAGAVADPARLSAMPLEHRESEIRQIARDEAHAQRLLELVRIPGEQASQEGEPQGPMRNALRTEAHRDSQQAQVSLIDAERRARASRPIQDMRERRASAPAFLQEMGVSPEALRSLMTDGAERLDNAESFMTWLLRMKETADYKNPVTRGPLLRDLRELIGDLQANTGLRRTCFNIAFDSLSRCGDAVAHGYSEISTAALVSRMLRPGITERQLIESGVDMFVLSLVDQEVKHKVAALSAAGRSEDIETSLALRTGLRAGLARHGIELRTPLQDMLYRAVSGVSEADLEAATQRIVTALQAREPARAYLASWAPLLEFVDTRDAQAYADLRTDIDRQLGELDDQMTQGAITEDEYVRRSKQLMHDLDSAKQARRANTVAELLERHLAPITAGMAATATPTLSTTSAEPAP